MVEFLVKNLKDKFKIATLSRGYKRKSEGFQLANNKSSAELIGDEPFQFYLKYKNEIQVASWTSQNETLMCPMFHLGPSINSGTRGGFFVFYEN